MDLYSGPGHLAKQMERELGTNKVIMVEAASLSLSVPLLKCKRRKSDHIVTAEQMLYRDAEQDDELDGMLLH